MVKGNLMRRTSIITFAFLLIGSILGGFVGGATVQATSQTMTFESLGYDTITASSFTIDFPSTYDGASGEIDLHFQTFSGYADLTVKINGAKVYDHLNYPDGDQHVTISIPTGVVDKGTNTLELSFSESVTLSEDSLIHLYEQAPLK